MFEYFVIPALRRMSTTIFNTLPHASLIKFACVRHLTSNENVILFHNNISFRGIIFFLVFLNSRPLLVISHTFLHASPTQLIIFFLFLFASHFPFHFIFVAPFFCRDNRADIAMFQSIAWTIGMCIMPLVFWLVRDWTYFMAITTLPLLMFAFFPK